MNYSKMTKAQLINLIKTLKTSNDYLMESRDELTKAFLKVTAPPPKGGE